MYRPLASGKLGEVLGIVHYSFNDKYEEVRVQVPSNLICKDKQDTRYTMQRPKQNFDLFLALSVYW